MLGIGCPDRHALPHITPKKCTDRERRSPPARAGSFFDPGCAKTRAFNLLLESSSQFGQSENQKCSRRLSEEGNRETGSTLSWLAHIFTRPGPIAVIPTVPPLYHIRELASPTRPILRREMALPPIVQRRPGFSK